MYKYFVRRKIHNSQQFNNIYNSQEIIIVEKFKLFEKKMRKRKKNLLRCDSNLCNVLALDVKLTPLTSTLSSQLLWWFALKVYNNLTVTQRTRVGSQQFIWKNSGKID